MPSSESRSELAGSHSPDSPGLPRGRTGLSREQTTEAQLLRLQRAVIAAVAERGFANITVTDIVTRARVSRREFYRHFSSTEDCFVAAAVVGGELLSTRLTAAARNSADTEAIRGCLAGFLDLCVTEPEFTRCLTVDLPAAGRAGLQLYTDAHRQIATLLAQMAEREAAGRSTWRGVPDAVAVCAVGAVTEIVVLHVNDDTIGNLRAAEDLAVDLVRRLFGLS